MSQPVRILLLADTHLGFDLPLRPRVARRRRGHDFLANYAIALAPALSGEVDAVVHGGDVFDRPRVPPSLAYQALEPLAQVADRGVPVFVVPGNHERSRLPHERFASHRNVHVFDRPRTVVVDVRGEPVAVTGFPCERRDVRTLFRSLVEQSGWRGARAATRVLCMHQCAEGATVGPADFVFRSAADVVRVREIPAEFAAVLSGHIHRHQVLTHDLRGELLETPVLYPGSIERTSLAEMDEPKGFMIVHVPTGGASEGNDAVGARRACGRDPCRSANQHRVEWEFRRLPARPMIAKEVVVDGMRGVELESAVRGIVANAPPDAVLRIRLAGDVTHADLRAISAARLRSFVPDTMNVDLTFSAASPYLQRAMASSSVRRDAQQRRAPETSAQLELGNSTCV